MSTRFFDPEVWHEIFATLSRNKTRTFLTAFGIFWGTAMLALLAGGASGLRGVISRQFAGLSTNMGGISSQATTMSYRGFNKGTSWRMTTADIEDIRRTAPAMAASSTINWFDTDVVAGDKYKSAYGIGVEDSYADILTMNIEGRFFNPSDISARRKFAVIGKNLANDLFPDKDPLGQAINLNGIRFTIIGKASQLGEASIGVPVDDSILLPSTTARQAFNQGTTVHFFVFTAPDDHKPKDNEAAIRRVICNNHPIHPDDKGALHFMDVTEMFDIVFGIFKGISILALFVGSGTLLAGVIGVGNIMWIIVRERTREFGIRRAIGARASDITVQVILESIVLTLIAGTAGICFATLILAIADRLTADPVLGVAGFALPFSTAVTIMVTFVILGAAAGTIPAIKAMKIKPIEAMRDK